MKNKICCLGLVFMLLLTWTHGAFCAEEHSWMWNVLVIPPQSGWESETGKSIATTLSWHEAEISESGSGIGGHDVRFDLLPPMDEDSALTAPLPIEARTAAVMSFAAPEVDRALIARMAGTNVPLFLSGGEDILFDEGAGPARNVFALDLYRDYRCVAFALYAEKTVSQEAHMALIASRFTVNQEREAKLTYGFLDEAGFIPMPFWVDSSVRNSFQMVTQEQTCHSQ